MTEHGWKVNLGVFRDALIIFTENDGGDEWEATVVQWPKCSRLSWSEISALRQFFEEVEADLDARNTRDNT